MVAKCKENFLEVPLVRTIDAATYAGCSDLTDGVVSVVETKIIIQECWTMTIKNIAEIIMPTFSGKPIFQIV